MTRMKYLLLVPFAVILGFSIKLGLDIHPISSEKKHLNEEYANVNRVNYGLFNIQVWKKKAFDLFRDKAQEFSISPDVYVDVEEQLTIYLTGVYAEYIECPYSVTEDRVRGLKIAVDKLQKRGVDIKTPDQVINSTPVYWRGMQRRK